MKKDRMVGSAVTSRPSYSLEFGASKPKINEDLILQANVDRTKR